jgi:hypothetical protein
MSPCGVATRVRYTRHYTDFGGDAFGKTEMITISCVFFAVARRSKLTWQLLLTHWNRNCLHHVPSETGYCRWALPTLPFRTKTYKSGLDRKPPKSNLPNLYCGFLFLPRGVCACGGGGGHAGLDVWLKCKRAARCRAWFEAALDSSHVSPRPRHTIGLDFMTHLPISACFDSVLGIVEWRTSFLALRRLQPRK